MKSNIGTLLIFLALLFAMMAIVTILIVDARESPVKPDLNAVERLSANGSCKKSGVDGMWNVEKSGNVYRFIDTGVIRFSACRDTEIDLKFQPQFKLHPPRLELYINGRLDEVYTIKADQRMKFKVQSGDTVSLAYLDFYYKADVRLINILYPSLAGAKCKEISIGFENKNTGGYEWNMVGNYGSIYAKNRIVMIPCGSGRLRFIVNGQSGMGAWPILTVSQGNKLIYMKMIKDETVTNSIQVSGSPLYFSLDNPSASILENRRLQVEILSIKELNSE